MVTRTPHVNCSTMLAELPQDGGGVHADMQVPIKPPPSVTELASIVVAHSRSKGVCGGRASTFTVSQYGRAGPPDDDDDKSADGADHGLLVSFSGVVLAVSSPWMQTHSRSWDCSECNAEMQTLGAGEQPSGCYRGCVGLSTAAMPRTGSSGWPMSLVENMSQR